MVALPLTDPFDHNAECTFCDEQGAHAADCSWLLALIDEVGRARETLEATVLKHMQERAAQEETIRNQLQNLGDLRRQLDEHARQLHHEGIEHTECQQALIDAQARLVAKDEELVTANETVEALRTAATDLASKVQNLVNWADGRGLLEDHVFVFVDGDLWEAKR